MDSGHSDARCLHGGILASRSVCRFRDIDLLSCRLGIRVGLLVDSPQVGSVGSSRPHMPYPSPALDLACAGLSFHMGVIGLDIGFVYRQYRALGRRSDHSTEHSGNVDACREVCRAMACMDCRRYRVQRPLCIQGTLVYIRPLYAVCCRCSGRI